MEHLTRACVINLEDFYDTLAAIGAKEGGVAPMYRWVKTPGPHGVWPHRIYGLHTPPDNPTLVVREIFEGMRNRRLPWEICVEQIGEMSQWNAPLEQTGMKLRFEFPSMAVNLATFDSDAAITDLPIELTRVTNEAGLDAWSRLVTLGWWKSEKHIIDVLSKQYRPFLPRHAQLSLWLAHVGGVPVATGMAHICGDIVGVYMIYVDPACRRHGLGGYITAQMAALGARQGCTLAILQATAEGEPVYRRLGFETVYQQRVYRYPWEDHDSDSE